MSDQPSGWYFSEYPVRFLQRRREASGARGAGVRKEASDLLLAEHGIYIQPINYPTVPRGTERLRITPTPYHDDALIDALADAMVDVWEHFGLPLRHRALAAE